MPQCTQLHDLPASTVPERDWLDHLCTGLLFYYLTSLVAVLGVTFGQEYVQPSLRGVANRDDLVASFANWDGRWYQEIAEQGYRYDPGKGSTVAFFPAFPLAGRGLATVAGCRTALALLIVAHLALAATFVVLAAYLQARFTAGAPALAGLVLLAFGLWPTTFFFRMAYSESLFLLAAVLALYGLERRWPLPVVALLVGAATATRPVGVALLPGLVSAAWRGSPTAGAFAWRLLWVVPLGCWGLACYMAYQADAFGEPLAFAKTQAHWRVRPPVPWAEQIYSVVTLEPLRSVFDPSSPCSWRRLDRDVNPLFSLHLANPIYFVLAVVLLAIGAWRRWQNRGD